MKRSEIYRRCAALILSDKPIYAISREYFGCYLLSCVVNGKTNYYAVDSNDEVSESDLKDKFPEYAMFKSRNGLYASGQFDEDKNEHRVIAFLFAAELAKDNERREAEFFDRIDRIAGKRKSGRSGSKIPTADGMAIPAGGDIWGE